MLVRNYKAIMAFTLMTSVALADSTLTETPILEYSSFNEVFLTKVRFSSQADKLNQKPVLISEKASEKTFLDMLNEQKQALKHVEESEKNLYMKGMPFKKDPYDAGSDLNSFIKKMRIDDGFVMKNESNDRVSLKLKFEAKNSPGFFQSKTIAIEAGDYFVFDKKDNHILLNMKILDNVTNQYLNPKFTMDGFLQMNIEDTQDRNFFHQYQAFDFSSKKFTDAQLNEPSLSEEEKGFRRNFNGSCDYMDFMGQQEGTSLEKIYQQRINLYVKNNIAALLEKEPGLLDSAHNKIPLVTHKIWVTSDDAPKDPSPQYIQWLENSIEHNKTSEGWTHIFWVENKAKLPNLTKLLENHPNIKLVELDALDSSTFLTGDLYKKAIKQKKFGKATDIIRLELLRQFGGFYLDTDYELFQSLKPYSKAYDMIMGLEPMSVYLCNAFMGARPEHPVVIKSLQMIARNLSDYAPDYIKNVENNGFKTIIETGPALVTAAFALAGGQKDNVDIVLPPQTIYPAAEDVYPKQQVVLPNGKIPAQAFGAHYWNTAWMDPRFGSQG